MTDDDAADARRQPQRAGVPWQRIAGVVLALLGLLVAIYLTVEHARGVSPICTGGSTGGCHTVAESKYATIGVIPVSAFGIGGYIALSIAALVSGFSARLIGAMLAVGALAFSCYLTYLELFRIHAICEWCVSSAVISLLLAIVHLWWLAVSWDEGLAE